MRLDPAAYASMRVDLGPPQCAGKDAYASRGEALAVLRRLHSRHSITNHSGRRDVRAYRCGACGLWHIGSNAL